MQNINHYHIPVITLRDVVIFPEVITPLFVGRQKSIHAIDTALAADKRILVVTQKNPTKDNPTEKEIYEFGVIATILQMLKMPDGTLKVLIEGNSRVKITQFYNSEQAFFADFDYIETEYDDVDQVSTLTQSALVLAEEYVKNNHRIPVEVTHLLTTIEDSEKLCDTIASQLDIELSEKQKILEIKSLSLRFKRIIEHLESEINRLKMESEINAHVKKQIDKNQKEFILNEQMKAIKKELGKGDPESEYEKEIDEIKARIEKSAMPKAARKKAHDELKKLNLGHPMSPETGVIRTYLETLLNVPWSKKSRVKRDLSAAQKILDDEHYGLDKVKERIVEYLAVQNRVKTLKGPILCLVGPPGVGKTSLGRSIAHATGREFVRMSLGGVRDEAEIRGHRRTYVGALPGKIISLLSKTGVKNPLFLLDEIDKMAMDFRGDPASALLEVLDPEQNDTFNDHYLEVDYDLSDVMFVTTANTEDIPPALHDRMEIIRLSGYTEDEKIGIAVNHLIQKQFKANGVKKTELAISEEAIRDIIRYYTQEAGVRSLEREIAKICRKVVKEISTAQKPWEKLVLKPADLEKYLGVRKCRFGLAEEKDQIGQVTGLAWTSVGGEILTIEAATMPGKGEFLITGQLGDVMQESIRAAMTVVKSRALSLGISPEFFEKHDIHIHVPEGAIPKDGPSAGITMCTALVSKLTNIPVFAHVAMTGEITLRGEVLPIGGLKEKLLAAKRAGIRHVVIPQENERDLAEISEDVKKELVIHPVKWIDDVLRLSLQRMPIPLREDNMAAVINRHHTSESEVKNQPKDKAH